jgi:hypothetical protein
LVYAGKLVNLRSCWCTSSDCSKHLMKRRKLWSAFLLLLLVAGLAGCASDSTNTSEQGKYIACIFIGDGCWSYGRLQVKPKEMQLSGDGTVFVGNIVWHYWGTARAIGNGTAKVDNCTPSCATSSSYSYYPATIILSDPKSWAGWLVYSHATDSVPAAHWHEVRTSGLMPGPNSLVT